MLRFTKQRMFLHPVILRVFANRCSYAGYIKTWTGVELGSPPNGGGGGLGCKSTILYQAITDIVVILTP